MLKRPVVVALSLFLALGGVAPAFGRPAGAVRPPAAAAAPVPAPPAPPVAEAVAPTDPQAVPPPGVEQYANGWAFWGPRIRGCESGNGPDGAPDYRALNRRSGASGAYQFMDSTWGGQYGVRKARDASPAEQEDAAYRLFLRSGTRPWSFSYHCWRGTPPASVASNAVLPASAQRPPTDTPRAAAPAKATPQAAHRSPTPKPTTAPKAEESSKGTTTADAVSGLLGRKK